MKILGHLKDYQFKPLSVPRNQYVTHGISNSVLWLVTEMNHVDSTQP